jgi:uncharacterized protein YbaR (Trm112 family)
MHTIVEDVIRKFDDSRPFLPLGVNSVPIPYTAAEPRAIYRHAASRAQQETIGAMRPNPPLSLYDLLACPRCKTPVTSHEQQLTCAQCAQSYPIVDEVPVMFPDGRVPDFQHQHELTVRSGILPMRPTEHPPRIHPLRG